ncbi:T9SS type A sorting domain-containing protein [candidate division KSB1 bacterium]|nr:T9SS type A sorting domain-containing protein [candidate division KSB1 bacterium]
MKKMKFISIVLSLVFMLIFQEYINAQYQIQQSVFGNGGTPMNNSNFRIRGTVSQPVIGVINTQSDIHKIGFWYLTGSTSTGIESISDLLPKEFKLEQNYPNPFNPGTIIEFALPKSAFITLKVYNLLGEEIITLVAENRSAGIHKINWDANRLASGVYMYRLEAEKFVQFKKLILIR